MKASSALCALIVLAGTSLASVSHCAFHDSWSEGTTERHVTVSRRLPDWSPIDYTTNFDLKEQRRRLRRAVPLSTLRRLMTNIALSEYYRIRGLEVLGKLNAKYNKPSAVMPSPADSAQSVTTPSTAAESSTLRPDASQLLSVTSPPVSSPTTTVNVNADADADANKHSQADEDQKVFEKYHLFLGSLEKKNKENTNSRYLQGDQVI